MTIPADAFTDIRDTIAALRESWRWLGELVEPGHENRSAPILTDNARERAGRFAADDRADRAANAAAGLAGLASAPAPARLDTITTTLTIRRLVLQAARYAAAAQNATYIGDRPGDHAIDDALAYLDGGPACWIATTTGVIGPQPRHGALDRLDLTTTLNIRRILANADRLARHCAGITGDDTIRFPHPCPACGARSLQWRMPSRNRQTWSVMCIRPLCKCAGMGCGCRQKIRYAGRRHAWAYGELDGTWGLWRAIAAARRATPPIRSTVKGHGGWAERRIG